MLLARWPNIFLLVHVTRFQSLEPSKTSTNISKPTRTEKQRRRYVLRCFHFGNTTLRASIIYRVGPGARQLQLKTEILKISRTLAASRFIRSRGKVERATGPAAILFLVETQTRRGTMIS